jgi:hypothetical protein
MQKKGATGPFFGLQIPDELYLLFWVIKVVNNITKSRGAALVVESWEEATGTILCHQSLKQCINFGDIQIGGAILLIGIEQMLFFRQTADDNAHGNENRYARSRLKSL